MRSLGLSCREREVRSHGIVHTARRGCWMYSLEQFTLRRKIAVALDIESFGGIEAIDQDKGIVVTGLFVWLWELLHEGVTRPHLCSYLEQPFSLEIGSYVSKLESSSSAWNSRRKPIISDQALGMAFFVGDPQYARFCSASSVFQRVPSCEPCYPPNLTLHNLHS